MVTVPRADTANFNRFVTSLGLLLVLVALLGPYFYFHDTALLRVPKKELVGLTKESREAIRRRQSAAIDLEHPLLLLALLLFVSGCGCLFLGGRRLWELQAKEDAAIDRQAQLENHRIKKQTDAEKEERLEEQALEAIEGPSGDARLDLHESRQAVGRTEASLEESFAQEKFEAYEFYSDVTVLGERPGDQIAVDGLFSAGSAGLADVVLDQKLVVGDPAPLVTRYTNSMLALVARYRHLTGRDAVGWLVLVLIEGADTLADGEREKLKAQFDDALGGLGQTTILGEDELAVAPARFRALFAP